MFIIMSLMLILILMMTFFIWGVYYNNNKLIIYECGFLSFTNELYNYYVKYYFIALLFLIFDIEIMLLYNFTHFLLFKPNLMFLMPMLYLIFITLIYELIYIGFEL